MKKQIWLLGIVAVLFGALGAYFGLQKWQEKPAADDAPHYFFAQTLHDINDNNEKMLKWQGRLLLVNFWATWCSPCVEEMPELSDLQRDQEFKNLQIIGIGIDSSENIRKFAAKYDIGYPIYVAGMGGIELSRKLGNQPGGLPFTVLFGPDGQIKKTYLGRLKMDVVRRDLKQSS